MATASSPEMVVISRVEYNALQAGLGIKRKIPRPKGEGGRMTGRGKDGGLRLGFQLREASWLSKENYDTVSDTIHMYTWRYCDINKNYSQNEENIPAVIEAARKVHKCLQYYEKDWLTKEIIKSTLRHTSTKYKLKDFAFKFPEEPFEDPNKDATSDTGDLEVEVGHHPDQETSAENVEEGPPRKRLKTGKVCNSGESVMDIESDDLPAHQPSSSNSTSSRLTPSRPTAIPKTYRRLQPQNLLNSVRSQSPDHHLSHLAMRAERPTSALGGQQHHDSSSPMQAVSRRDHVTSTHPLRASTRDITLASRSPSPFVHGQVYSSASLPDVAAQYDRSFASSPPPRPQAKPHRPNTERTLQAMYKEELVECKNQLRRYNFNNMPSAERPALWEMIKKRIIDDRVHLHLKEVVDIVQYSDRLAFPIAGGAFDSVDCEMKRLEGELVANGENEEPPATSTPVTQLAPRSLAPVPQLNQASASNRPGIHNKKVVGARQTLALSEYVQAAFATPKSSRRPPTTPKTTQIQEEMPSSAASTSHRAALAAQNFSKLISNGEDISAPSSPLRSLANQLNIHSDSEDSGSVYQANEEEEQEFMSPPKPNKGKGKAKAMMDSDAPLTLKIPKRQTATEVKQQGKKTAMLPPAPPSGRQTRSNSRAQFSTL